MTINLRVVGVYFQEDITITVIPSKTSIKDVMDAAMLQFPGFSYKAVGATLYAVSNRVRNVAIPYVLRDSDRSKPKQPGETLLTWQSYIIRNGVQQDVGGAFVPFGVRFVEDGDSVIWRLVAVSKRDPAGPKP